MAKLTWKVNINEKQHTIQLDHGYITSKRKIQIDGQEIVNETKFVDIGSKHQFKIDGKSFELVISTNGNNFEYYLFLDGIQLKAQGNRRQKDHHRKKYLAEQEYWKKLAEVSGLSYVPLQNASGWGLHRLLGYIDSYLTVIRFVPAVSIYIFVRFAPLSNPVEIKKQVKSELEKSTLFNKSYDERSLYVRNDFASIKIPCRLKNETPEFVFSKIALFVKTISQFTHPVKPDKCEGEACELRSGDKLRLVFVNGFPEYYCEDCTARISQVLAKGVEDYKSQPDKLLEGIAAGLPAAVGGGIIWALTFAVLDWFTALITMMLSGGMFMFVLKAMDKVGTKRTKISLAVAAILSILGVVFGACLFLAFFLIKNYPDHISVDILYTAWQSKNLLLTNSFYGFLGVLPVLWLAWSSLKQQLSSALDPEIEIIEQI